MSVPLHYPTLEGKICSVFPRPCVSWNFATRWLWSLGIMLGQARKWKYCFCKRYWCLCVIPGMFEEIKKKNNWTCLRLLKNFFQIQQQRPLKIESLWNLGQYFIMNVELNFNLFVIHFYSRRVMVAYVRKFLKWKFRNNRKCWSQVRKWGSSNIWRKKFNLCSGMMM